MTDERRQYDEQVLGIEDGPSERPADGPPIAPGQDIEGAQPSRIGLDPGSLADNTGPVTEPRDQDPPDDEHASEERRPA